MNTKGETALYLVLMTVVQKAGGKVVLTPQDQGWIYGSGKKLINQRDGDNLVLEIVDADQPKDVV